MSPGPVGYSVVNVDQIDGAGPGGAVRFVRRHLGVEAFGINWFELPPGTEGPEHDQVASGQEEMSDGMAFVSVGARRGSYEPRGPF
jgi:hypothetical protein